MDIVRMRRADRRLGVPACLALTLCRRVLGGDRPRPDQPVRSILFIKLAEQGSTVLAYSALQQAVEMVGREHVYFLCFEQNRFVLDLMDLIPPSNVITIRTGNLVKAVRGALGALRTIRRLGIDAVVDMEFYARSSAALAYLTRAPIRVGLHGFGGEAAYRGDLFTHRLHYNPHIHTSQFFQQLVQAIAAPTAKLPALNLPVPPMGQLHHFSAAPELREEVAAILLRELNTGELPRLILLNANCSDLLPLRRWPNENYLDLARRLLAHDPRSAIAFTGAPSEAPSVQELVQQIGSPRCISMAGKTTMTQLMGLYCLADVLVTNDSGPAHFASMTDVSVVVLFGPETPRLYAAPSPRQRVVWSGIVCSPCVSAYNDRQSGCHDPLCMKAITVDQVLGEVLAALAERRSG